MRKLLHIFLNRIVITALIVLLQIGFFVLELSKFGNLYIQIAALLKFISVGVVIWILFKPNSPEVKMAWIVPILLFPLFGGIFYLAFGHVFMSKRLKLSIEASNRNVQLNLIQKEDVLSRIQKENANVKNQCCYLKKYAASPVWDNVESHYFGEGIDYLQSLLKDLEEAKYYIFMEFFILARGKMWDDILEVLERKVAQGVEVRLIYDDVGCAFLLPKKYFEVLRKKGIQCVAFNRLIPFMSLILNNRDHRKIVVIDGNIAYTGGINIADEYANYKKPYGEHWKDAGVRFAGEAVWSFAVFFLQMWNMSLNTEDVYTNYRYSDEVKTGDGSKGFLQPYVDTPLDNEIVGENVYLNMIYNAKHYVYIYTPYLIIGHEMVTALRLASKRGVDVRIVTPGVPDKKMIFWLTQSNYKQLVEAGITILQYTPGFIHSKCVLVDDELAAVGSVNFDYRSFYHHFECGVLFYRTEVIEELKEDMLKTFEVCEEMTAEWCKKKFVKTNIIGPILKLFSPLL